MIITITLYSIITLLSIFAIVLYGSRPAKSLSWVLVVLLLPFLGPFLYMVFGINRRRFKFFPLKQTMRRKLYDIDHQSNCMVDQLAEFTLDNQTELADFIKNSSGFWAYDQNEVTLLKEGNETFEEIFETIKKATKFVHIQYYILEEGELLARLHAILEEKIKEGVEVRIIYDAIGSYFWSKKSKKRFKDMGVKIYTTMPIRYGSILFTFNYRNHRKIIIVDGNIGFTGGFNITDKYIKPISELGIWEDIHVKVQGPIVDNLHRIFIKDYYFASSGESLLEDKYLPEIKGYGDSKIQIVSSGPDSAHPTIMHQYIKMITLAKKNIYISNPYFIPNSAMLESLRIAALSGVKVKLLVPFDLDSRLAKYSMLSYFEELLFVGVEVYLDNDNFLHNKLIIMDGEIASIGSGNFDHRSFEHNFETNALIYDTKIAIELSEDFENDCKKGELLDYETYKKRSLKRKLAEGLARFFSPLL